MRCSLIIGGLLTGWMCASCSLANDALLKINSLEVHPSEFVIAGSRESLQLLVTGLTAEGDLVDLSRRAKYTSLGAGIVKVDQSGRVTAAGDGQTKVQIHYGPELAAMTVTAKNLGTTQPVSFDYHTLPVLAQSGCSGGSCHGSPHGKAGFRLSLFASDRELDRISLTRELFSRRVNPIEPDKSLLLKKPTTRIAHQGGKRFSVEDEQYKILRDWIAEGCSTQRKGPDCLGIQVFPAGGRLLHFPHSKQQIQVFAKFSDGSLRDVTHLAKYESSDPKIATVGRNGLVEGLDRGESAIVVRYLHFIESPLMTFVRDVDGFQWPNPPEANYVDRLVYRKLQQLQYVPAGRSADHVFLRRVYLDLLGGLPTEMESETFLRDGDANKRAKLIDELLQRPEHARFWAQKWGDLLRISTKLIGKSSTHKFSRWLENCIATNKAYDEFASEILLATGSTREHPAGNFYRSAGDTSDAMETAAQVFLGTRIQCAKCHNHPFERWTQENYYGLSAFFNRVQRSKTNRKEEVLLWSAEAGEVNDPATGDIAEPWVPVTGHLRVTQQDRRHAFVAWLTSNDNPLFAKIEVNRIWAQLMGRGIVEPFDDFRDSNPPANAPLLEALAKDFVANGYDRRKLLRVILSSNTYQASAFADPLNRGDVKYFSHYVPRMMTAEQLIDAPGFVTGKPENFYGVPESTKATWLPAPDLQPHDRAKIGDIEFLKVFGQPERQSACECERSDDVSLGQALELVNGQLVSGMLTSESNLIHSQLRAGRLPQDIVIQLYRRAYCRLPDEEESGVHMRYVEQHEDHAKALEDLCWAILNRNEFLFQH